MGIRLDQLHNEVFEKIANDLESQTVEFKDFLDNEIAKIDVVFGLPEVADIKRSVETNKRNLEKSGFIEINRSFMPIRKGEQSDTGVWISNLDSNESPFEPQTIDGQKRGVSIAGQNINYTRGKIGQDIDKMMKLPAAPNLPVFFPEDNDMTMDFRPTKIVTHQKPVINESISIVVSRKITDFGRLNIDKTDTPDGYKYYYMDEDSRVFYLNDEGRMYLEENPDKLLTEEYKLYNVDFANEFSFERIIDNNAELKYIDSETNNLFEIKTPAASSASEVELTDSEGDKVYIQNMVVTRSFEENGQIIDREVEQPMLVKFTIDKDTKEDMESDLLVTEIVSEVGLEKKVKTINGQDLIYVEDNEIEMYINSSKIYYYHPYRKIKTDSDGNIMYETDSDGDEIWYDDNGEIVDSTVNGAKRKPIYVDDDEYVTYLTPGESEPENGVIENVDNITGETIEKNVYEIEVEDVKYYTVDMFMHGNTATACRTDEIGDYKEVDGETANPNVNRPVRIDENNKLVTITAGSIVDYSDGKEYFFNHEYGTKYYKNLDGEKYYISEAGEIFKPENDVVEIFEGIRENTDINDSEEIEMYVSEKDNTFFIGTENERIYIKDESEELIQFQDIRGNLVFEDSKGNEVLKTDSGFVTIDENGNESESDKTYSDLMPVFEVEEVEEEVLNKVFEIPFNIIQGDVEITKNGQTLSKYSDYNVEGILSLKKPLEYNIKNESGDTLYIKRVGKKDIILRMEKKGTPDDDFNNDWAENKGQIVMPEILTGNEFDWTDGQELESGQELGYGDIVKKDRRFYEYTGTAISYEDMPEDNKKVVVQEAGVFWEEVTSQDVEWESRNQNYLVYDLSKNEKIRFTVVRRVWKENVKTGEMEVKENDPYSIEKTANQDGDNLFAISDSNFNFDDPMLESYILTIEKIEDYSTYELNRANNFELNLTGLQTVSKNEDTAMIYGDSYFLEDNVLYLSEANMQDSIHLERRNAPQSELKIELQAGEEQPKITVPFEIDKNKFDIVVPQKLDGHEYTWIMGESLPEGKALKQGDVVFDKDSIRFYEFIGQEKRDQFGNLIVKKSLLRQPVEIQKELIRQFHEVEANLLTGKWFYPVDEKIAGVAKTNAEKDNLNDLDFLVENDDGDKVLNVDSDKVVEYFAEARQAMVQELTHELNKTIIDEKFEINDYFTSNVKDEVKEALDSDLDQFVLKKIEYDESGSPVLDEDSNIVYYYEYTRNFMLEKNENGEFISRDINGNETVVENVWKEITADSVGYYRFGKTFTILDTKEKDNVVVKLQESGADVFTSKRVESEGGEITFSVDFNIEEDDGEEIPFDVIYEEINWMEGEDYIKEGQDLTLTMVTDPEQDLIIRRNDEFDLSDLVVLERKDLVFIETWHEAVDETGFIFPNGNVQFAGNEYDGVSTVPFEHEFYMEVDGEEKVIENGAQKYCQVYQKGNVVYNYYDGTDFEALSDEERKYVDETFVKDTTLGKGWVLEDLSDSERDKIFQDSDNNLYYDGEKLVQIRYRTRVVALNLFENYFKGTSDYLSKGLRFQGKSPVTSKIITKEVGEQPADSENAGQPIIEVHQEFMGEELIISSSSDSLLYKNGKLYDDALFTVENPTDLSHNGYVHAIPVAIVERRNQGVYHPEFNKNGTSFFINGIHVAEDEEDFADDISGFALIDQNDATLQTASTGRNRKSKFKTMIQWLFDKEYKAGGSMVSRTTYRPDGYLYDEINSRDVIDLRIDANDQRKRIEDLETNVEKGFKELYELQTETKTKFEQTENFINTTSNLIYDHIGETEDSIRSDMNDGFSKLTSELEETNTNLADLSANVFSKDITKSLLIDSIVGLTDYNTKSSFVSGQRPSRDEIEGMISAFVENMSGPYNKHEFMKFLVTVLKSVIDKTMLTEQELDRWIRRLSVKDLSMDASSEYYSRAEALEIIYDGLILASSSRVLPPIGADKLENWNWKGIRYDGWLGTKHLDLKKDFLENEKDPEEEKDVNVDDMTRSYTTIKGEKYNSGYIAGPTVWGDVHKYHAIYTSWIFVEKPFKVDHVKMYGDDTHAIFINKSVVATNKHCCRETAYSYNFSVPGWYRIDMVYSENGGGHYVQLGWNPKDYQDKIKYMTTKNMDESVRITKLRLDNWAGKLKQLISTIKGDATGYFTILETKLIMVEGLRRIRQNILENGTGITEDELELFHTGNASSPGLESWLNNVNGDGKFSSLGYEVKPDENDQPRSDEFRPVPDLTGSYNKVEVVEIIKKGLQLVNGIDSLNGDDIQKWVDRLNIEIPMSTKGYIKTDEINEMISDGLEYLAGLDNATSYEVSTWFDVYVENKFIDANGDDITESRSESDTLNKGDFKDKVAEEFKKVLGAQSEK